MALEVKLSTTGTLSPVTFPTLGGISFTHPTVDFHMLEPNGPFQLEELTDNIELQSALDSGHITLTNQNNEPITNVSSDSLVDRGDLYDAIVDASGTADYSLPSHAFTDGAKTVFVRDGIYIEDANIVLPDGGLLVGETAAGTIIELGATYKIIADGNGGTKETAGTLSITHATKAVTGVGTTFTNLSSGEYILLGFVFYKIDTITDDTNLTITETYYGKTLAAEKYQAHAMFTGVTLQNFHVTNGIDDNILFRGLRHSKIETVGTSKAGNIGLLIEDCGQSYGAGILATTCNMHGIDIETSYGISLNSVDCNNNQWMGICTASSGSVIIDSSYIKTNKDDGITVTGDAGEIKMADCIICFNGVKGIDTDGNSHGISAINCTLSDNGNAGIDFDSDRNVVTGCHIFNNGSYGIQGGSNGVVTANHVNNNGGNGINLAGDTECTIVGNIVHDNAGHGIFLDNDRNVISSNRVYDNTSDAINLTSGANDNIVIGNVCSGHTTEINDAGTNTVVNNVTL